MTCKVTYQFLVLHSLSVDKSRQCRHQSPYFSAHDFLSIDILSNSNCSLPSFLCDRQCLITFFNWSHVFAVYRTMLSDKQTEHSFNPTTFSVWSLQLKMLLGVLKKLSVLTECFMLFKFTMFRYI